MMLTCCLYIFIIYLFVQNTQIHLLLVAALLFLGAFAHGRCVQIPARTLLLAPKPNTSISLNEQQSNDMLLSASWLEIGLISHCQVQKKSLAFGPAFCNGTLYTTTGGSIWTEILSSQHSNGGLFYDLGYFSKYRPSCYGNPPATQPKVPASTGGIPSPACPPAPSPGVPSEAINNAKALACITAWLAIMFSVVLESGIVDSKAKIKYVVITATQQLSNRQLLAWKERARYLTRETEEERTPQGSAQLVQVENGLLMELGSSAQHEITKERSPTMRHIEYWILI